MSRNRLRRLRPSPAMVVAIIALVTALAGTGYAAFSLPRNSVGPRQIKNRAVGLVKISRSATASLRGVPTVGYAHVSFDGKVDGSQSKNVGASNVHRRNVVFCFGGLHFNPRSAQVSAEYPYSPIVPAVQILPRGKTARDCNPRENVEVVTQDADGGFNPHPFYIVFY
jgi:hypothetical protein